MSSTHKPEVRPLRLALLAVAVLLLFSAADLRAQPVTPPESVLELQDTFVKVAAAVKPCVVAITTQTRAAVASQGQEEQLFPELPFDLPPELQRRFRFRMPQEEPAPTQGEGSGFVVHPEGYIITNYHVAYGPPGRTPPGERTSKLTVRFPDDQTDYPATVVGADEATDLAVIKVERTGLQAAVLGSSSDLRVGDWVLAIGNPYHLPGTVTAGIVSAVGRQLPAGITGTSLSYADYIQTDAPINPGNSGGPLVDIYGRVVGVNELILSPLRGNIGLGFAIPIDLAKSVYQQLRAHGKVHRGWLGISFQKMTPDLAERFGTSEGVVVNQVFSDGPAAAAGLKVGDVITAVNGKKVVDGRELAQAVAEGGPEQVVRLDVLRNREPLSVEVTTAERPSEEQIAGGPGKPQPAQPGVSGPGFRVVASSSREAQDMGIDPNAAGVVVADVAPQSNAYAKGLRPGFRILEMNGLTVNSLADFTAAASQVKRGDSIVLLVADTEGNTMWIGFKAGPAE
jgi:serine protease Do